MVLFLTNMKDQLLSHIASQLVTVMKPKIELRRLGMQQSRIELEMVEWKASPTPWEHVLSTHGHKSAKVRGRSISGPEPIHGK